jgi:putative transposase
MATRPQAHYPSLPSFLDIFEHLYYTLLMSEILTRTICIKLDVDGNEAALCETQRQFNAAATWIAALCWQERITNSNTAHHRVYGQTRVGFGLGAQLAVCARAKAMEAIKSVRRQEAEKLARWRKANTRRQKKGKKLVPPPEPASCPQFGPRGSIRYDARTYRLLPLDRVSLNTLEGRITARLLPGQRQHEMLVDPDSKVGGAELVWRGGIYFLHVTQRKEAPDVTSANEAIGIDLGICNVATDSEGEQFTGAEVREKRRRFVTRRTALQRVGTRSAKRRLKQMSGRERRYMKQVNHTISKALIKKATVSRKALALEDLTGLRESVTVRREQRYEQHSWAFFQLRLFLTYKAAWAGVEVRLVDPAYTSQTCSCCGHCESANRQSQSSFRCQQCGFCCHADYNSARNIALVACQAANGSAGTSAVTSPRL